MRVSGIMYLMAILLVSCQGNTQYHAYQPVKTESGWWQDDTLIYHIPDSLTGKSYQMELGIRHTTVYPYQDLWLEMEYTSGDSLTLTKDTLHILLANKGIWNGKGKHGLMQLTQEAEQLLSIPQSEEDIELRITHLMSDTLLKGIHDIGIQLKEKH